MPKEENPEETEQLERVELPEQEEPVRVRLDEEDDEQEETPAERPQGEQPRDPKTGKWGEKKAARGKEHRESKAWQQEKAEYDARIRRMQEDSDRRFQQLQQEVERLRSQPQHNPNSADPFEAKLADIEEQLEAELRLIEQDDKRGYKRYNELRRQEQRIVNAQDYARMRAEEIRQQQNQPHDPYAGGRRPIIEAEYPWVLDQRYTQLAQKARTYKNYLVEVQGRPDTIDTDREALSHIAATLGPQYGMNPPPAPPSQRTRALYAAPPSRGAPYRGEGPTEIEIPPQLANGTGLDMQTLKAAVRDAVRSGRS